MYVFISGSSKEMKQTLASIVTLSVINRTTRQKNTHSKDVEHLNITVNQLYKLHIYRILYLTVAEYMFSFSIHECSPR